MDKMKLMEVFNELLDEWYWAEDTVLHDRDVSGCNVYQELEQRKKAYEETFLEALKA
ncbi:hypothetical protein [Planococcus sp. SSTMD024]|uniref:hypothetical protein n=1 Tax=Planococcus sp. SSTMD024 TaxID=3242163 RepID=UPI00351E0A9A